MTMQRAMLWFHWRSCRNWIVAAAVAIAGLPIVSVKSAWPRNPADMAGFLAQLEAWGVFYPAVALVVGLVMAIILWQADRRGRFVYAATLPDSTLRVGARVVLALVVLQVLLLLIGVGGNWLAAVGGALVDRRGPLALLGGRWMLIDV